MRILIQLFDSRRIRIQEADVKKISSRISWLQIHENVKLRLSFKLKCFFLERTKNCCIKSDSLSRFVCDGALSHLKLLGVGLHGGQRDVDVQLLGVHPVPQQQHQHHLTTPHWGMGPDIRPESRAWHPARYRL